MGIFLLLVAIAQDPGALIERLRSDQVDEREEAGRSLLELGRPALPGLEKASRDPDSEVAARARLLVRKIRGTADFTPALLAAFPGIEDRLGNGSDHDWTLTFLLALRGRLSVDDLAPLAPRALRGASTDEEKTNCCLAICHLRLHASWKALVEIMKKGDDQVCRAASQALRMVGTSPEAKSAIVELLRHPNAHARLHAANILPDLFPDLDALEAIPPVTRLLTDPDGGVRGIAAGALARLQGGRALPKLLLVLKLDPAPWVRLETAKAIHFLRPRDSHEPLLPLLRDPDGTVRLGVLMMLDSQLSPRHGRAVAPLLGDPDPELRKLSLRILCRLECREAGEAILPLLQDPEGEIRTVAASTLGELRVISAGSRILPLLGDPEGDVRTAAAEALGRLDCHEAAPGLIRALEDRLASVRRSSILSLSRLDVQEAVPALARRLPDEKDVAVAAAIYETLGDLGGTEGIPELIRQATLGKPEAMITLGRLGAREAIPILLARARAGSIDIRAGAIRALAYLPSADTVPTLLETLGHPPDAPCLCEVAGETLAAIDLERYRSRVLPLLRSGTVRHRVSLAKGVVRSRMTEAIPDLTALLGQATDDARGWCEAAWALGELRAVASAPLLVRSVGERDIRTLTSLTALARMEALDQVKPLVLLLSQYSGRDRLPVAEALCQLGEAAGVPDLLAEKYALWTLNALRAKNAWKTLREINISTALRRPTVQALVERLERENLKIEYMDSVAVRRALETRLFAPGEELGTLNGLRALEMVIFGGASWILESDRIRIVSPEEAGRFWLSWWEEEKKKKP
jgi:HEAT repeat protein